MKLKHITVIKPLLVLIGNIITSTDSKIEESLIKLPEFKDMIKFCFESSAFNLIGSCFYVMGMMMTNSNPVLIDYFVTHIDILRKVTNNYINHKDLILQKEA
mmetsp:Transcript_29568/g.26150  ORF Transcript_29568/g.26150 Transcript_29568/m.26150 type:complete len:102 (+) Transcript_29568:148-453(+)